MSFNDGGFYDQPSGGGGPTSGQTRAQVDARIRSLVAAQALSGNTQAWPGNKVTVTIPNTDGITEGNNNLFFTTERALSATEIPLTLGSVTGGNQHRQLRTATKTGGNAIDIPSGVEHGAADGGLLLELNGFYAQVLFKDILDLPVDATNDTTVDTSGNTQNAILFRSPSLGNGYESIYVGATSGDKLLLAGASFDGTTSTDATEDIKIYPLDHARHGTFNRDDAEETTLADDDYVVFFDTSESFSPPKRISVANLKTAIGSTGGGTLTAAQFVALVDNNQGNVDASESSGKVVLTASGGGGGGSFTLTAANLSPILNDTLLVDSTLTKTYSDANDTVTLGVASTAPPTGSHNFYVGHQASLDFSSWVAGDAENTYDVSQAGAMITTVVTNVPDDDYVYLVAPQDREPTSVLDSIGAESVNDFAEQVGAVTISGTVYNVYTYRNISGRTVPNVTYRITVES